MRIKLLVFCATASLLFAMAGMANANLIINGTFDTDLSTWQKIGNADVVSGFAYIGYPGPDGVAALRQEFALTGNYFHVSFDYLFYASSSATPAGDIFRVNLYASTTSGGPYILTNHLIDETYGGGSNTTNDVHFDTTIFMPTYNYGLIEFVLDETPTDATVGTRIELDNVIVDAAPVPEPTTMFLLGTGLVGVAGAARRKKKNQA